MFDSTNVIEEWGRERGLTPHDARRALREIIDFEKRAKLTDNFTSPFDKYRERLHDGEVKGRSLGIPRENPHRRMELDELVRLV